MDAAASFETIPGYKDADERVIKAREKAEEARKDAIYHRAVEEINVYSAIQPLLEESIALLETIPGWRDSDAKIKQFQDRIDELDQEELEEEERLDREEQERFDKIKKIIIIIAVIALAIILIIVAYSRVISPAMAKNSSYEEALLMLDNGEYEDSIEIFQSLGKYKDSANMCLEAETELDKQRERLATEALSKDPIDNTYLSSLPKEFYSAHNEICYAYALALFDMENWDNAETYFNLCRGDYESADDYATYAKGRKALNTGGYDDAINLFGSIKEFNDANKWLQESCFKKINNTYLMDLESVIELLHMPLTLDEDGTKKLNMYEELLDCSGTYKCYKGMTENPSKEVKDIEDLSCELTLTFTLQYGVPLVTINNSLLNSTLADKVDRYDEDGYDFYAIIPVYSSDKVLRYMYQYYFSSNEAKYVYTWGDDLQTHDIYYYQR